jgi:hypothetical protein
VAIAQFEPGYSPALLLRGRPENYSEIAIVSPIYGLFFEYFARTRSSFQDFVTYRNKLNED